MPPTLNYFETVGREVNLWHDSPLKANIFYHCLIMKPEEQLQILRRGVEEIVPESDFLPLLKQHKTLRVKMGVDPTAPDVHLGHTVVMRKLRAFQDLGHQVILIVGDYTATVGDPSGKNKTRPILTHEEVLENSKTYQEQFFKVVRREKTEVRYNGDWFSKMNFQEVIKLMSQMTVAQMLEREDFQNRYRGGQPISLHEFMYPMMQGYDSVMIQSHVELGGTDQKFNILRGRELQKAAGQTAQIGMLLPILLGTNGSDKMSKSLGNYIGLNESAQSMYHKLVNIPDSLIESYYMLLTDIPQEVYEGLSQKISQGIVNPIELKQNLAHNITAQYHGEDQATHAASEERKIHAGEALPEDVPELKIPVGEYWPPALLCELGWVKSNGEGRRMIQNGGVTFDQEKMEDPTQKVQVVSEHLLRMGKRKFAKIIGF